MFCEAKATCPEWFRLSPRARQGTPGATLVITAKCLRLERLVYSTFTFFYLQPDLQNWDGTFEGPADTILRQHAAQSGLRPADEKMAQWVEFIRLHVNQPLNFKLFANIIASVTDPLNNGLYSDDEVI